MKTKMFLFVGLLLAGLIFSSCQKENDLVADTSFEQTADQKLIPPGDDLSEIDDVDGELLTNFPDPFTESTTIQYELLEPGWVTIYVSNQREAYRIRLVSEFQYEGRHEIVWDASKHPPGVYFVEMKAGGMFLSKQMIKVTEEGNGSLLRQ